ncbi:hypothetical protein RLON56S_02877 [Alishewanella longhuensis]
MTVIRNLGLPVSSDTGIVAVLLTAAQPIKQPVTQLILQVTHFCA